MVPNDSSCQEEVWPATTTPYTHLRHSISNLRVWNYKKGFWQNEVNQMED